MSEKIYKIDNHRQLAVGETIRKGDLYRDKSGKVQPVKHSIGCTPYIYAGRFTFFRRKHTKKQPVAIVAVAKPVVVEAKAKTPRFPEVKFLYPSTKRWGAPVERHVKVISRDDKYIVGLEVLDDGGHQFKRFCVDKVKGEIRLIKF